MRKYFIPALSIAFILSCTEQVSNNSTDKNSKKVQYSLFNSYGYDTLTVFARYTECGEWGGHSEMFKIFLKNNKEVWADYIRDSVNCEGGVTRKIVYERKFKLEQEHQELIIQYTHDLINQNFSTPILLNALEYYSIITSDSSLVISYHADHYEGFDSLREKLVHNFR